MRHIDAKTQLCQVDKVAQVDKLQRTQNQYVDLRVQQKNEHKWGLMVKRKQVYHVESVDGKPRKSPRGLPEDPQTFSGKSSEKFQFN